MENLHEPEDEPQFEGTIDFSFETDPSLDLIKVQRLIVREISFYNPDYQRYIIQQEGGADNPSQFNMPASSGGADGGDVAMDGV